jgi:FkbM family methyltransferase
MTHQSANTPRATKLDYTSRVALTGASLPPMISYAQNFEDVLIRRALQDVAQGFYIDIGAFDSTTDSVTRWFYDSGWRGVNVEPNPALHAKLEVDRSEDENLWCALSSVSGSKQFNVIGETGLSTLSADLVCAASAAGYDVSSRIEVPVETLDQLLSCYGKDRILDFVKLDVEGSEGDILNATLFTAARPRLLIIEAVKSFSMEPAWAGWEPNLLSRGFRFVWFDGLNRFYLREEDIWRAQFFRIPPCVFDNFTPHYFATVLAKAREAETLLEIERTEKNHIVADLRGQMENHGAAYDILKKRTEDLSGKLIGHETLLAECNAANETLQAVRQELLRTLTERELELASRNSACEALQREVEDVTHALAQRDLQLAERDAAWQNLQREAQALAESAAEKEMELLLLSIRLDARQIEMCNHLRRIARC